MPHPRKPSKTIAEIGAGPNFLDSAKNMERITAGSAFLDMAEKIAATTKMTDTIMVGSKAVDTINATSKLHDMMFTGSKALDTIAATSKLCETMFAGSNALDTMGSAERASRIGDSFRGSIGETPGPDLSGITESMNALADLKAAERRREIERQVSTRDAVERLCALTEDSVRRAEASEVRAAAAEAREAASEARHEARERWLLALTFIATLAAVIALLH